MLTGLTSVRVRRLITVRSLTQAVGGGVLLAAALTACATDTTSSVYTGELATEPVSGKTHALGTTIDMQDGYGTRPVIIDTGSIYYFASPPAKNPTLSCTSVETFNYAVGVAKFCPSVRTLTARDRDGSMVNLVDRGIEMGVAQFSDWEPGIPDAVLGLAGNMQGENASGIAPVIDQLQPQHLSFRFPNGGLSSGTMSFGPLPADRLETASPIPLENPGSLGYGYTANVKRMEFIGAGKVLAAISYGPSGVFLESGSKRDKIADQHLAFFDTGTPLPLVFSNGDVSLLGNDIAAGNIGTNTSGPFYDELRIVFDSAENNSVTLKTEDLGPFQTNNPSAVVPTKAEFPANMKMLASVIGYPVLAQYDFQIDFDGQTARDITFVNR